MNTVVNRLPSYFVMPGVSPTKPKELLAAICEHFNLTATQLQGGYRGNRYVTARAYFFYIERQFIGSMSFVELGKMFGRDHSTVIHAINTFKDYLTTDEKLENDFRDFLTKINPEWANAYGGQTKST